MEPILKLIDVNYSYHSISGETPALKNISLDIQEGEFISIVGPSGCGKSTLLNLISGLIRPETGSIYLKGTPVLGTRPEIGYMLQKDHLFEWRSVYKNILLGLEIQDKMTPENLVRASDLIETYGLKIFQNVKPSALSGGMRQRAALIRTLVLNPELLLLDEPFSALDYQTRLIVSNDIGSIIKKEHKTAILVTHDLSEAISMADRVVVLSHRPGKIKCILPIELDIDDRTPFSSRGTNKFKDYFNFLWKELNSNDQ